MEMTTKNKEVHRRSTTDHTKTKLYFLREIVKNVMVRQSLFEEVENK